MKAIFIKQVKHSFCPIFQGVVKRIAKEILEKKVIKNVNQEETEQSQNLCHGSLLLNKIKSQVKTGFV